MQIFPNIVLSTVKWMIKNIYFCLFKSLFNWSPHFFTSFSKPAGIPSNSCENSSSAEMGFQLVPKYQRKVKLISNISVWNAQRKMQQKRKDQSLRKNRVVWNMSLNILYNKVVTVSEADLWHQNQSLLQVQSPSNWSRRNIPSRGLEIQPWPNKKMK